MGENPSLGITGHYTSRGSILALLPLFSSPGDKESIVWVNVPTESHILLLAHIAGPWAPRILCPNSPRHAFSLPRGTLPLSILRRVLCSASIHRRKRWPRGSSSLVVVAGELDWSWTRRLCVDKRLLAVNKRAGPGKRRVEAGSSPTTFTRGRILNSNPPTRSLWR